MGAISRLLCGFRGHDYVRAVTEGVIGLRCSQCGSRTPGITAVGNPPRRRFDGDSKRHIINNPRLLRR